MKIIDGKEQYSTAISLYNAAVLGYFNSLVPRGVLRFMDGIVVGSVLL